ncbi:MAG: hypothetical protein WB810_03650 [Candidatus Cybelea sp.]
MPYAATSAIVPANGFGCPNGHLNGSGGAIGLSGASFKVSFGYAANTGNLCPDHVIASRANLYQAPKAPNGWTALLYVEARITSHPVGGKWQTGGPQRYIELSGKRGFEPGRYYCLAFYVPSEPHELGSQWTRAWASATVKSDGSRRLRFAGAPPYYTPFFDGPVLEWVNTTFELLESSRDVRC